MRVFIRTDSSLHLGTGHVMRCVTLASALRRHGFDVVFICRALPGDITSFIEERGFRVLRLPRMAPACDALAEVALMHGAMSDDAAQTLRTIGGDEGWLVVDHYALDARWERLVRPHVEGIMVIDDLADRPHACDVLLDQGLHAGAALRYEALVEPGTRLWLGPAYALLRDEFVEAAHGMQPRDGTIRRLLISLGGSDPRNFSAVAIEAARALDGFQPAIDVVVPPSNPHRASLSALAAEMPNVVVHGYVERMSGLMRVADLAIGAGGTTTWERCALGLPTILLVLAENQASVARNVADAGAAWNLGDVDGVTRERMSSALSHAIRAPGEVRRMSAAAMALMRGAGTRWLESLLALVRGEVARDPA